MYQSHFFMEIMAKERQQALLEQARRDSLVRQARRGLRTGKGLRTGQGRRPPLFAPVIAGIGRALVALGERMQRAQLGASISRRSFP